LGRRLTGEYDQPDALQCAEINLRVAIDDNQVSVKPLVEQPLSMRQPTDAGRLGGGCGEDLGGREASFIKQCDPDVEVSVSHPGIQSGIDSNDDAYASSV
jgi:hypothetical protein